MPQEYARLELAAPIPLKNGNEANEIVIYRPTCRQMTEVLDATKSTVQVERFVTSCCRAMNGTGEPQEFKGDQLMTQDGSELAAIIAAMVEESDAVMIDPRGDGVTSPIVYDLRCPIKLTAGEDGETVYQIQFEARKLSDISDYLDSRGSETKEFHAFMRNFGKVLGVKGAMAIMTDVLIDALDWLDYLVIRRQIMGKLTLSRGKWRKVSSRVH